MGVWGDFSEWKADNSSIWISFSYGEIDITSSDGTTTDYYDILVKNDEVTTPDGDKETVYDCFDIYDNELNINLMTRSSQDGRTELYIIEDDKCTVYVIHPSESTPATNSSTETADDDDWY